MDLKSYQRLQESYRFIYDENHDYYVQEAYLVTSFLIAEEYADNREEAGEIYLELSDEDIEQIIEATDEEILKRAQARDKAKAAKEQEAKKRKYAKNIKPDGSQAGKPRTKGMQPYVKPAGIRKAQAAVKAAKEGSALDKAMAADYMDDQKSKYYKKPPSGTTPAGNMGAGLRSPEGIKKAHREAIDQQTKTGSKAREKHAGKYKKYWGKEYDEKGTDARRDEDRADAKANKKKQQLRNRFEKAGHGKHGKIVKQTQKMEEEFVMDYLVNNGYATNYVSAEVMLENMSNDWFNMILSEG